MADKKNITDAVGMIGEEYLNEYYERREQRTKNRKRLSMVSATAASLAVIVAVSAMLPGIMNREEPTATVESATAESTEAPEFPIEHEGPYPWQDGYTGDMHGSGGAGGPGDGCPEHGFSYYHAFDARLMNYVGQDAFDKWREDNEVIEIDGFCSTHFNIKNFVDDFGISRETFDELINLTAMPYNLDVIYSKDAEYVDEYYSNEKFIYRMESRALFFSALKSELNSHIGSLPGTEVVKGEYPMSVPELIVSYKIERETLESIMSKAKKETSKLLGDDSLPTFNYDLDIIYNEDGSFKELPVFDENDTAFKRWQTLNELFCRVYEDWGDPSEYPDPEKEEEKPVRGEGICTVHHVEYHGVPMGQYFIDAYPERYAEYSELINSTRKDSGDCRLSEHYNIRSAIEFFGLTKDDVVKYFGLAYHVDIDYIMSADPKEIEEYYTDLSAREKDRYRSYNYNELKSFIYFHYNYPDGTAFGHNCVPYMVYDAKIPREELEAIIAEVKRRREPTNLYYCGYYNTFDYNLDLIYNEDGSFKEFPEVKYGGWHNGNEELYREYNLKFCGMLPTE